MASAREQAIQRWNLPKHPEYWTLVRRTRTFYKGPARFKFQTSYFPPLVSATLRHRTLCSTSSTTLPPQMTYMYIIPYALLVVPQLPNRCRTCTIFLTTREIISRLNYFISLAPGWADGCLCFYYSGAFHLWNETDIPLIVHAKFFPACPYIRYVKGHVFTPDDHHKNRTQID